MATAKKYLTVYDIENEATATSEKQDEEYEEMMSLTYANRKGTVYELSINSEFSLYCHVPVYEEAETKTFVSFAGYDSYYYATLDFTLNDSTYPTLDGGTCGLVDVASGEVTDYEFMLERILLEV